MEGQGFGAGYNLALTVDKSRTEIQDDVCKRTSFIFSKVFPTGNPLDITFPMRHFFDKLGPKRLISFLERKIHLCIRLFPSWLMRGSLFSETQFIFFQILIHSSSKAWDKGEWCERLSSPLMYLTARIKERKIQAFKYIGKISKLYLPTIKMASTMTSTTIERFIWYRSVFKKLLVVLVVSDVLVLESLEILPLGKRHSSAK